MALMDPYAPCPCGSGQKFKWCCHKVEAVAERAQRLFENGQAEASVAAIDDGLKKEPRNAWLLTRKALYLTRMGQPEPAKDAVRLVLEKSPKHAGAQMLMTRLALETEGPAAGAAQLQQALTAFPTEGRSVLAGLVKVVGAFLAESGEFTSALKHLKLANALNRSDEPDPALSSTVRMLEGNPTIVPWLKNPDELSPVPEGLSNETQTRFSEALAWAGEGLWSSAAAAFETLSSDPVAGPLADRNLGFCRLWLADYGAAVLALRRYASTLGVTTEAVDVEALSQQVAPPPRGSMVEQVQLTWPVRDRNRLVEVLTADPTIYAEEPAPLDPEDPDSPMVTQFVLLDRAQVDQFKPDLRISDIPLIEARAFVGTDTVTMEVLDDGRLERLSDRFTTLAGTSIPPAHPKTKVVSKVPKFSLALAWDWLLPEGVPEEDAKRLDREQGALVIKDVWPETPNPALHGRTPLQAARDGNAEVPLRALVFQFENGSDSWREDFDFVAFRSRLQIPPEPSEDPETVDIAKLHLARLALVPIERLSDEKLVSIYQRARLYSFMSILERAARALVDRPDALERLNVEPLSLYTDLASVASSKGRSEEALDWIRRGREADSAAKRARNAPAWDMFEIRLRVRDEDPTDWVADLAVILERYRNDAQATQTVMMNLIDMGLLEMVPNPDRPGEIMIDSRRLQVLMSEYGPRVTTASGRLGVSASKPEIWTPGSSSSSGSGGGLWTPGSAPSQEGTSGGEKKLILPGR